MQVFRIPLYKNIAKLIHLIKYIGLEKAAKHMQYVEEIGSLYKAMFFIFRTKSTDSRL